MALFGAPTATPEDACNAVSAAIAMQRQMARVNEDLRKPKGCRRISIGIGLHTGEATVGYIGSERRSEYTAIGDTVNLGVASPVRTRSPDRSSSAERPRPPPPTLRCSVPPRPPSRSRIANRPSPSSRSTGST